MKGIFVTLLLIVFVYPSYVFSSSFYDCKLTGNVTKVGKKTIEFVIIESMESGETWPVCDSFIGKTIEFKAMKNRIKKITVGDVISVRRLYADSDAGVHYDKYELLQ